MWMTIQRSDTTVLICDPFLWSCFPFIQGLIGIHEIWFPATRHLKCSNHLTKLCFVLQQYPRAAQTQKKKKPEAQLSPPKYCSMHFSINIACVLVFSLEKICILANSYVENLHTVAANFLQHIHCSEGLRPFLDLPNSISSQNPSAESFN